jgi:hypothetical protein
MPNDQDRKKVTDELESLQLEESRFRVKELRNHQDMRRVRAASVERSLKNEKFRDELRHNGCKHRKGGKGVENIFNGNDANYAVIKNQRADGVIIVICQRCDNLWEPPDPALNRRGAPIEDRKLYAKLLAEYTEAVNYPTDNTMSGSQLFVITREQPLMESVA